LRLSSIDELPQLINVLRGDMSLVGPRPIVRQESPRYGRYFDDYCKLRPGITGLWQVSGRNDMTYRRRVAHDVVYSRRSSLALDMRILLMTIPAIAAAEGCY
jgi:exopolysaccharide production protein ExoY